MARRHLHNFLAHSLCGIRISAVLEAIIFLALSLAIERAVGAEGRFATISPHPFWIIVLLITVQYGAKEALLCALLASACLLVGNMPVQYITENSYDYIFRVIHLPILWITTAMLLGAIRSRHLYEYNTLKKKLTYEKTINGTVTTAYNHLKAAKESMEIRLAEEQCSSIVVYEAAKSLETIDQRKLLESVKNIVITTLNPTKFSIYALRPTGLEFITCHGWKEQECYALTFPLGSALYEKIVEEKRVLCVVNEEDESIFSTQGILAGPILDNKTKEVFGMLKIEEMGVLGVGMRSVEIFKVLCEWIGMAHANAKKYQIACSNINIPVQKIQKEAVYNARKTNSD